MNAKDDLKELLKAGTHKYIKRIPNPKGKPRFIYFYNQEQIKKYNETGELPGEKKDEKPEKSERNLLSSIMSFFGFNTDKEAARKVNEDYKEHNLKDKFDISAVDYAQHLEEYFKNKEKWDKFFSEKKGKKSIKSGKKSAKTSQPKPKTKKSLNLSVMKFIYELYGKEESNERRTVRRDRGEQSASVGGNNGRKNVEGQPYYEEGIQLARSEKTKFSENDHLSENSRRVLRKHQRDFVNLAIDKFNSGESGILNMDSTGAGKTLQELALAETYQKNNPDKPILIVTKNKRIIDSAFMEDAKLIDLPLTKVQNPEDIDGPGIYITAYNRLTKFDNEKFGLVVCDESHSLKNKDSQQSKSGMKIIENADNTALFSATPLDKGVHIPYLCKSFGLSTTSTMRSLGYELVNQRTPRGTVKMWKAGVDSEELAFRLDALFSSLTDKGLAVKREVELSNLDVAISNVDFSDEFKERYNSALTAFVDELSKASGPGKGLVKAKGLMALRRLVEEGKTEHTLNKIQEGLKEGKQIVLFATRVNDSETFDDETIGTLKNISAKLTEMGIDHANVYSSSKTAKEDIAKFQNGNTKVILTTPESGGTGLSLDDTTGKNPRKAIVMTPPFSAMDFIQLAGRVNRLTTKSRAEVEMLVSDTMVDGWNKDIIANKLLHLGSAVKGDYEKLNIDEIERLQYMSDEEISDYMSEKNSKEKVAVTEERNIDIDDHKPPKDDNLKSIGHSSHYINLIPTTEDGSPDFSKSWPDVMVNMGKHKGKTMSEIQKKDASYLNWMFETMGMSSSSAKHAAVHVDFHDSSGNVKKAAEGDSKIKGPSDPLRCFGAYETFIPTDPVTGEVLADSPWPDAVVGFGKHKGKNLSKIQMNDPGYLRWLLNELPDPIGHLISKISFQKAMEKALRFMLKKAGEFQGIINVRLRGSKR